MGIENNKNLTERQKDRKTEWDVLRILLTLLVVLGHINYTKYDSNSYQGFSKLLISNQGDFLTWIYTFHMPAFIFLSGLLFSTNRYERFDELIWDKFKKLVIPTYLLQMIVIIPVKMCTGMMAKDDVYQKYFDLFSGIEGVYDHLWFMMALFWCVLFFYFPCKYLFNKQNIVIGLIVCGFLMKYIPMLPISKDYYLFKTGLTYLFVFALGWIYDKKNLGEKIKIGYKLVYIVCYLGFVINSNIIDNGNIYVMQVAGIVAVTFMVEIINGCVHGKIAKDIIVAWSKETKYVYFFHVPLIWISVIYFRGNHTDSTIVWCFALEVVGSMALPILGHKIFENSVRCIKSLGWLK